jgi:hypothetical protein
MYSMDIYRRDIYNENWNGFNKNNLFANSMPQPWRFTDAANHDYTLTATSPAVDSGEVLPGLVETFVGSAPDLGAYEYGGDHWIPGPNWNLADKPWVYPPTPPGSPVLGGPGVVAHLRPLRMIVARGSIIVQGLCGPGRVAVYDASGSLVASATNDTRPTVSIDSRRLARGMYVVRVVQPGSARCWKTVLSR